MNVKMTTRRSRVFGFGSDKKGGKRTTSRLSLSEANLRGFEACSFRSSCGTATSANFHRPAAPNADLMLEPSDWSQLSVSLSAAVAAEFDFRLEVRRVTAAVVLCIHIFLHTAAAATVLALPSPLSKLLLPLDLEVAKSCPEETRHVQVQALHWELDVPEEPPIDSRRLMM